MAGVPLQVRRRCEAPHPSRFGLCQPGGVVQEFTADWKREGVSNEKLRRLQQIAGCRVQIAKSFKTQGPPLPWFLSDLNLRNFYIAALLRQRLTVQWFFIGLQRNFDDSGTRRIIGTNPSRFLDDHSFGHFQRGCMKAPFAPKFNVRRKGHQFNSADSDEAFDFHPGLSPAFFDRNLRLICLGKIFVDPQFPAAMSWRHLAKPAMQISRTFIRIEPSNLRGHEHRGLLFFLAKGTA